MPLNNVFIVQIVWPGGPNVIANIWIDAAGTDNA